MIHSRPISIAFAAIFICILADHSAFAQDKKDKIEELIGLYAEYHQFNGTALVAENGALLYQGGFGHANMEWDIKNTPDTKFRLGSITKQFTAMLVLQLAEQGKIDLQAAVTTYVPEYPKATGDKITVHHLLTHTSGIPNYTSFPGFMQEHTKETYSPNDFIQVFADSALNFEPGSQFSYSNSGYFLLGVIIENVSGVSYEQLLTKNIFEPLNMKSSGYDHHSTILPKRAAAYERRGGAYVNAEYLDMSIPYAAGSMYSTVEDLFLWDKALYTDKILSEEFRKQMFEAHIPAWGNSSYGYGFGVGKEDVGRDGDSLLVIGHGGGINGFNTLITRIADDKNTVILLNNTGGADLNTMTRAITNILYENPYDLPKRSAAMELLEVITTEGIDAGLERYKELSISDVYDVNEREMNNVGYQLLGSGSMNEAIEVFKLNVEAFPESGNVYDSLGEAYLAAGNKELAIKHYSKSVEVDPKNENGKKILDELLAE